MIYEGVNKVFSCKFAQISDIPDVLQLYHLQLLRLHKGQIWFTTSSAIQSCNSRRSSSSASVAKRYQNPHAMSKKTFYKKLLQLVTMERAMTSDFPTCIIRRRRRHLLTQSRGAVVLRAALATHTYHCCGFSSICLDAGRWSQLRRLPRHIQMIPICRDSVLTVERCSGTMVHVSGSITPP